MQKLFGGIISQPAKIVNLFQFNKEVSETQEGKDPQNVLYPMNKYKLPSIQRVKLTKVIFLI
jgi:hypothetical protein